MGGWPQRPPADPRPCPPLGVQVVIRLPPTRERPRCHQTHCSGKGSQVHAVADFREKSCQSEYLSLTSGRGWKFSPERCMLCRHRRQSGSQRAGIVLTSVSLLSGHCLFKTFSLCTIFTSLLSLLQYRFCFYVLFF